MEQMVTIKINGCEVTVPAEQEQIYREALADKWIDGHRVYVENNDVKIDLRNASEGVEWNILTELLIEQNNKIYALAGKF